jgi:hypothetical protein
MDFERNHCVIFCSQLGKVGHSDGYPALIVSVDDALGWKRYGGFERNRTLNLSLVNDRVWLEISRRGSLRSSASSALQYLLCNTRIQQIW